MYVGGLTDSDSLKEWEGAKVIKNLAFPNPIFGTVGTVVSALSASIQGMITAPRLLVAMAKDDVLAWLRPVATKPKKEPWKATW